jgi:hypothetical protein
MWESPPLSKLQDALASSSSPIGMRMRAAYFLRQAYENAIRNKDEEEIEEKNPIRMYLPINRSFVPVCPVPIPPQILHPLIRLMLIFRHWNWKRRFCATHRYPSLNDIEPSSHYEIEVDPRLQWH